MKILVVDDDPAVVQSVLALLGSSSEHEVRSAPTAGQALQAAAVSGVELLITDVVMEPMDGFALRNQFATRYPQTRVIFITGYDLSDYAEQLGAHQVLMKPIEQADLLAAIKREFPEPALPAQAEPIPEPPPVKAVPIAMAARPAQPQPVAGPKVVPAPAAPNARPTAVPRVATPVAAAPQAPKVAAVPQAASTPRVAVAASTPTAPRAVAAPRVAVQAPSEAGPRVAVKPAVAATPQAHAVRAVAVAAAPVAIQRPVVAAPPIDLSGQTIGAYQIQALLGQGHWGSVHAAVQTSINRQVALKILDPARAHEETSRARFLADARAKANVQHPAILAVYEAGEADGYSFYTHEFVEGRTLAELHAGGEQLPEQIGLKVLKVAAEGLNYLHANRVPHAAPQPSSVYLGADGHPRLANLATQLADHQVSIEQEIQILGRAMLSVLPPVETLAPGFRTLLMRMVQGGAQAVNSWAQVIQGIKALEPKVVPLEAAKISAQDRAAIATVEGARKAQKRSLYINIASMGTLLVLAIVVIWKFVISNERTLDAQVRIAGGDFIFGSGQTVNLPDFWIDKYEVTIGQYAKFVQYLEGHPTSEYDHERQPRQKTAEMHKPRDWAIYFGRAGYGKDIHGVPSDLNMPALTVDFWDAYAYAKWKGRELPTEQEWEKAARGTRGFIYPWGDEFDPKKVNSNADYIADKPAAPGKVDGFNYWGSVDKQPDKSPFGVFGMAGNVAEWTATWTEDKRFPIIKGGSYMSGDTRLDTRIDNVTPDVAQENIGFRTITRTPPTQ